MAEPIFYRCDRCSNLVAVLHKGTCVPQCCGHPMERLVADSCDAATEKHVPAVSSDENGRVVVNVGTLAHPMVEAHHISWIAIAKEDRLFIKYLKPGEAPKATFCKDCAGATVYAYCNLHGLWKAETY